MSLGENIGKFCTFLPLSYIGLCPKNKGLVVVVFFQKCKSNNIPTVEITVAAKNMEVWISHGSNSEELLSDVICFPVMLNIRSSNSSADTSTWEAIKIH